MQSNVGPEYMVAIAPVRTNPTAQQCKKTYTVRQQRNREHVRQFKRCGEARRKAQTGAKLAAKTAQYHSGKIYYIYLYYIYYFGNLCLRPRMMSAYI